MCGRYEFNITIDQLIERYRIKNVDINLNVKGEMFPSQFIPVVVMEEQRKLKMMKWGFNNPYSKKLIINARSETVDVKSIFKKAFLNKRCLIPASSFFEWKKDDGKNIKHSIKLKDYSIFSLAGIYETFKDEKGNKFEAVTVLTTQASYMMKNIHNRMPVIIKDDDEELWLSNNHNHMDEIKNILNPYDGEIVIAKF